MSNAIATIPSPATSPETRTNPLAAIGELVTAAQYAIEDNPAGEKLVAQLAEILTQIDTEVTMALLSGGAR